jgi:ABC-type Zn uptake system ZnuABC Zn-binding protein ZnuA
MTNNHRQPSALALPILLTLLAAAGSAASGCRPSEARGDDRPRVVATTTMLGDLVETIAGDDFETHTIMRAGADPHLYRPTPSDARRVASADAVVINGLHLEGWADELIENAGGDTRTIVASDGVDVIRMPEFAGGVDPHFWFDVGAWKRAVDHVAEALSDLADDPAVRGRVTSRAADYKARLDALDAWVRAALETIPQNHRILVTSHDAFHYFSRAYALPVAAVQGISTESEASQRDVLNIVRRVKDTGAPAVFAETSVNPDLIERVAREAGVTVAGPLYSDSLGPEGGPADNYEGMLRENVRMIVTALGGTVPLSVAVQSRTQE